MKAIEKAALDIITDCCKAKFPEFFEDENIPKFKQLSEVYCKINKLKLENPPNSLLFYVSMFRNMGLLPKNDKPKYKKKYQKIKGMKNVITYIEKEQFNDYFNSNVIYYLYHENEIVYIGQTNCLMRRISEHYNDKIFDTFSFFIVDGSKMERLQLEKDLIKKNQPKYNQTFKNGFEPIDDVNE